MDYKTKINLKEIVINLIEQIISLKTYIRILILVLLDIFIINISLLISSVLLSVENIYYFAYQDYKLLYFLILFSIPIYYLSGQYRDVTRFIGSKSIYKIMFRNGILVLLNYLILRFPISLGFVIWTFISSISCTLRIILRDILIYINNRRNDNSGVLIYGAGAAGARLLKILKLENKFLVKGFIDDERSLWGRSISGVRIYPPSEIENLKLNKKIKKILLAIPSINKDPLRRILMDLIKFNINVLQIPRLTDIITGKASIDNLRPINVEDFLGRDVVHPQYELLAKDFNKKIILVTGAGGSIGSELCRELCNFNPSKIVLFEISEPALYRIYQELNNDKFKHIEFLPLLGSASDFNLVDKIISENKVNIVFHAAAYKHVPLVEMNPLEGVKNNVFSTRVVCECANKNFVEKFILISSDKAVRPTNLMGASKRISELLVQAYQHKDSNESSELSNRTTFLMVRFGNVLNSSGSVIPLFQKQIKNGGPITLTHEKITRYFMTINEACQLVIQATSFAKGGDLFLLDMGEPIEIKKLAKQMISLSGLTLKDDSNPEGDIEIVISGLRPGEKLFEELLIENNALATKHPLIFRAKENYIEYSLLMPLLDELEKCCSEQDLENTFSLISKIVPEWKRFNE